VLGASHPTAVRIGRDLKTMSRATLRTREYLGLLIVPVAIAIIAWLWQY